MLDDEPDAWHIVDDRQYEDLEASHFVAVHRFDYLAEYAISLIGGVEYIGESQYADAAGEKVVQRPCMIFVSVRYEASYHLAELPAFLMSRIGIPASTIKVSSAASRM